MTDARLLARHLEWAATSANARNEDFNVVNGDVFRWNWMWSRIAEYFGIEAAPFDGKMRPLEHRMQDTGEQWSKIAARFDLVETDIGRLASWWHTDADLGRPMRCHRYDQEPQGGIPGLSEHVRRLLWVV